MDSNEGRVVDEIRAEIRDIYAELQKSADDDDYVSFAAAMSRLLKVSETK